MLILEDNGARIEYFKRVYPAAAIVKTAKDAIYNLNLVQHSVVSLDHDLNGEAFVDSDCHDCGMEVVRWIVANRPPIERILLHTANRKASKAMKDALVGAGYKVYRVPFGGVYDERG